MTLSIARTFEAVLNGTDEADCVANGRIEVGTNFVNLFWSENALAGVDFSWLDVSNSQYVNECNMTGISFANSRMDGVIFGSNCTCTDANFDDLVSAVGFLTDGCSLARSTLRRANLAGAVLDGSDLSQCNLDGADLRGTSLAGCDLRGASLIDTIQDATTVFTGAIRDFVDVQV